MAIEPASRDGLTRRGFLYYGAAGAAGAAWAAAQGCGRTSEKNETEETEPMAKTDRPTNVVLFLCDDLGWGDLACYGHPGIRTPNLDRMAREGLRLTDCYAAAPVCSPARAGLLTGRPPDAEGVPDWVREHSDVHLRSDAVTVATLLRRAGYATCLTGKWHVSGGFETDQPTPADHGFDHWFATQNNAHPSHRDPDNFWRNGEQVGPLAGYSSTLIVEEGIRWLRDRPKRRPFFLFVSFHSPHEPVATGKAFTDLYPDAKPFERAIYYGNVSQMDHEAGRLLAELDEQGLRDETLVFFTSDNGPETLDRYPGAARSYGTPGPHRGMKLHLYEGGIRVPGILRGPMIERPGRESAEPVSGVDVLPTLCELAWADVPDDRPIFGTSVLPVLRGEAPVRERPLYWEYRRALGGPKFALRDGRWKVLAYKDFERFELYDLAADPEETTDLAAEEPDRLETMADALRAAHAEVAASPRYRPDVEDRGPDGA